MIRKIKKLIKSKVLKIKTEEELFLNEAIIEDEFKKYHQFVKDYTMTSVQNQYALYQSVNHIIKNNVKGDIVECGVWKGGSSLMMASILTKNNVMNKNLYLYDTYTGMTSPSNNDFRNDNGKLAEIKFHEKDNIDFVDWCYSSIEEVKSTMNKSDYPKEKIFYVKGKVEDTLKSHQHQRISLLRLDTDFYESTKIELEELFPLVSKNGIIIIDDYGHWAGAKKAVDEYFTKNNYNLFMHRVDYTARLIIKT